MAWELILAGGVVAFGMLYALKEFFDLYFERQEMKARLSLINRLESEYMINQVSLETEGKKIFKKQ
jgi:uncharacterized protein with ACT and thioredoxin-like domain